LNFVSPEDLFNLHSLTIVLRVERFCAILLARKVKPAPEKYCHTDVEVSTDSLVTIAGYSGSTKIPPLQQAFETINLNVTLPGLKTDLLSTAALTGEHPPALPTNYV
jgi:hypothetical protein